MEKSIKQIMEELDAIEEAPVPNIVEVYKMVKDLAARVEKLEGGAQQPAPAAQPTPTAAQPAQPGAPA
jgi:hypothetical protein